MIEYVMLIMLGFFAAGLIALLLAPTLWRRAVRLTTRRFEATMPMSVADIEADKDMLRASYAVQIRRLETALEKAREKSAAQLVEISKLQMDAGGLHDQVAALQRLLDERSNAANVFEKTIKKRFPELEAQLTAARAALEEREIELSDFRNKASRKEEAVALAQQASAHQQNEIRQLRETLEKSGAEHAGRFKKRPAQWTLEEYRSEYDRLNLELSKMREQLAVSHERESHQAVVLKTEMQQLAERIMSTVAAQEKQSGNGGNDGGTGREAGARLQNAPRAERPLVAPKPWPREQIRQQTEHFPAKDEIPSLSCPKLPVGTEAGALVVSDETDDSDETVGRLDVTNPSEFNKSRASIHAPAIAHDGDEDTTKTETRAALKTLLDRSPRPVTKGAADLNAMFGAKETAAEIFATNASVPAGLDAIPAGMTLASFHNAATPAAGVVPHANGQETAMDRMLHEIFENRSNAASAEKAAAAATAAADDADSKKVTLLDRLRVIRDRHTG